MLPILIFLFQQVLFDPSTWDAPRIHRVKALFRFFVCIYRVLLAMYSIYSVLQSIPYTCDNASFRRLVVSDRHFLEIKKTHQHHRCRSRPEMHLDFETAAGSLLTLASIGSGAQNEKVLEFTPLKS